MVLAPSKPRLSRSHADRLMARSLFLGGFLALWMLALAARLYQLQIIQYVDLLARAQRQQQRTVEIAPQRGALYDRQMRPLAMSRAVDSVVAVPAEIRDRDQTVQRLASLLALDADELRARFQSSRMFCWVKRKVSDDESRRVRELNLPGIYFQKEMKRFYPKGELAAQVLGYVGLDGNGLAGLEYSLDDQVKGRPGHVLVDWDAHRHTFRSTDWQGQAGKDVVLTLDENIQYIAERALAEAIQKWSALAGTVIVQNPNTGEILAAASQPSFNPNDYRQGAPNALLDRPVGWVFEPGSTFKLVTVSAALEEGITRPEEMINCQNGSIVLAGHTIHDHKPFGDLSVEQVIAKSSDVGAIKLGLRLGEERLYRYARAFGFGAPTGVELPGEERGLLKPPSRWSGISVGEISMGQEIGVTPLQLVTAYSSIASGGVLFQPRIVRDIFRGASHYALPAAPGRRVVSEKTALLMRRMLMQVVESGTGRAARLSGYSAAGKTGTAEKIDETGAYSKSHFIASFVGFAPATRPAVTILVTLDSPVGAIYGGEVAAPVFKVIAEQALSYLNIPQDNPAARPELLASAAGQRARAKPEARREDSLGDLDISESPVARLRPTSFSTKAAMRPEDVGNEDLPKAVLVDNAPLVTVPNFKGMSVRRVANECQRLGLELNLRGSGLAVEQDPAPGVSIPPGARVAVRFAR